jgi:hypothetical protein
VTNGTRLTREAKAPYAGTEEQQEHRLEGGRIALHRRAALGEDQHLARRLQEVVGGEQQEDEQRHQQRAGRLVLADIGDRRQQTLERPFHSTTFCGSHGGAYVEPAG